jgi:protein-S-isoprenylcysteine O-methyltransferase Ste14
MEEDVWSHFGMWWAVALWIVLYGSFALFLPYYKKSRIKPTGVYMAFVVAFAIEMFGVPFSLFVLAAITGSYLPEGIFWGHTLGPWIGLTGMYLGIASTVLGIALAAIGWKQIHRDYWSKEAGKGRLVTDGLYRYIRHPQYTGFFLVTLGVLLEWTTLPLLALWATLLVVYVRLAKKEETDMEAEFGQAYRDYRASTGMFWPRLDALLGHRGPAATVRPAAGAH